MEKLIRTLTVIATASALTLAGTAVASALPAAPLNISGSSVSAIQDLSSREETPKPTEKSWQARQLQDRAEQMARYRTNNGPRGTDAVSIARKAIPADGWSNVPNVQSGKQQHRTVDGVRLEFYRVDKRHHDQMGGYFFNYQNKDQKGRTWGVDVNEVADANYYYVIVVFD